MTHDVPKPTDEDMARDLHAEARVRELEAELREFQRLAGALRNAKSDKEHAEAAADIADHAKGRGWDSIPEPTVLSLVKRNEVQAERIKELEADLIRERRLTAVYAKFAGNEGDKRRKTMARIGELEAERQHILDIVRRILPKDEDYLNFLAEVEGCPGKPFGRVLRITTDGV